MELVSKNRSLYVPQNCNVSKARHVTVSVLAFSHGSLMLVVGLTQANRLPEDGSDGPKHVGANMGYFNCTI